MLTVTYSIVALRVEHKKARWTFSSIQQYIMNGIRNIKGASKIDFENMLHQLSQFEQYYCERKIQVFLIPALRKLTHEADPLLDEIESLGAHSNSLLRSLGERIQEGLRQGRVLVEEVCSSLELCCSNFYRRLAREEELVRVAERLIPSDAWFGIAANFLSHDASRCTSSAVPDEEE
ncbi:MAG: hypothetical protein LW731_00580 [Oxalobacteraceae bacterium]|jgi:hypothetical protein|nr:hypothetical protein [Oxalobacteraceae bacterium]